MDPQFILIILAILNIIAYIITRDMLHTVIFNMYIASSFIVAAINKIGVTNG